MSEKQHVISVAIVSPFQAFTQQARRLVGAVPDVRVVIYEAALEASLQVANTIAEQHIDVIVSRGATAEYLKKCTSLPVVSCDTTFYDLAKTCSGARKYGSKIAAILFGSRHLDIPFLCDMLDIEVMYVPHYINSEDIKDSLRAAVEQGCKAVVGSVLAVDYAKQMGIPGVIVDTSFESLEDALNVAVHLARVRRTEREQSEKIRVILDFTYSGVIAVNADGRIEVFNKAAQKMFHVTKDCIGKDIRQVVANTRLPIVVQNNASEIGEIQRIDANSSILTNRVPLVIENEVIGAVATFNESKHIQRWEEKLRKELVGKGLVAKKTFRDIYHHSPLLEQAVEKAKEFAVSDLPVLIYGETGTGKEGFAQSIHNASPRAKGAFVAINCSALPENLLESELFGYEEGAFSGAKRGGKQGLFELAHEGTIFLDEIGNISASMQSRLLRVLQEKEVMRLGSNKIIPVDFRLITATNVDLSKQLREKKFRADLYFRINVLRLNLPVLRNCLEDIAYLAKVFLIREGIPWERILTPEFKSELQKYRWPGNIRELEAFCQRLAVLSSSRRPDSILKEFLDELSYESPSVREVQGEQSVSVLIGVWDTMEREIFCQVVHHFNNNRTMAASVMGISRSTLWKKMKEN